MVQGGLKNTELLLGARQDRYLRSRPVVHRPAQVYVQGFSAGSYSGICLFCGTCLMSKWEAFWEALLLPHHCYMGSSLTMAGQGIKLKLMARPLAPRCGTHLWSPGCTRNCISIPALHNSAWGSQHIGVSNRTAAR